MIVKSVFNYGKLFGGGLNLREMRFNFVDGLIEFVNLVVDFIVFGNNGYLRIVRNVIDGNLLIYIMVKLLVKAIGF